MAKFQHVDPTGRFQFWIDDREITVDGKGVEVTDPREVAWLDSCPMVKRADKAKETDS